jgi:hypothetical protein
MASIADVAARPLRYDHPHDVACLPPGTSRMFMVKDLD